MSIAVTHWQSFQMTWMIFIWSEPPCGKLTTGRPSLELLDAHHASSCQCNTLADGVYVSKVYKLSLKEYCVAHCFIYFLSHHGIRNAQIHFTQRAN